MRQRISACSKSPEALRDEGQGTGYRAQGTGYSCPKLGRWGLLPRAQQEAGGRASSGPASSSGPWACTGCNSQQLLPAAAWQHCSLRLAPCDVATCDLRPVFSGFAVGSSGFVAMGHGLHVRRGLRAWTAGGAASRKRASTRAPVRVRGSGMTRGSGGAYFDPMHPCTCPIAPYFGLHVSQVSGYRVSVLSIRSRV